MVETDVHEQADPAAASGPPARRRWRWIRHEWTVAALGSLLLAVVMTWPTLKDPRHTVPGDPWDPFLQSWQLAWNGWALLHEPGRLWDSNAHFGERWGLAYSDSLLGYLPFGLVGSGPQAALLRYNILYVLAFALTFFGMYVLARQLGARPLGALVAGAAFAYSPWRLAHISHLNILSAGGIVLSLAMLARGHGWSLRHGYRPERVRPGWALAGWLVAAWQLTLGFGIGLAFGYVLALCCLAGLVLWLRRRPALGRRLVVADVLGAGVFVATVGAMAYPYLQLIKTYPDGVRSPAAIAQFSFDHRQFFIAPQRQWLWGDDHAPAREVIGSWEAHHLPGYFLLALAAAGLLLSVWTWRQRVLMALGVAVFAWLAMGLAAPSSAPYEFLFEHLPGWNAIRTPGRLILWATLLLALLAAGLVTVFADLAARIRPAARQAPLRVLAAVLLLIPTGAVLVEGVHDAEFKRVPESPVALPALPGPILVLPTNTTTDQLTQLWSTDGFVTIANGSSGFIPAGLWELRDRVNAFPDADSVAYLRARGIRTVLAVRHPSGSWWPPPELDADGTGRPDVFTRPIDGLGIVREELPDAVIYRL